MFKSKTFVLLLLVYIIFVTIFTYFYIGSEAKIYQSTTILSNFLLFDNINNIHTKGIISWLIDVFNDVQKSSLNIIHVLPILPFVWSKMSRYNFVLGVSILYMTPIVLILINLVYTKLIEYSKKNTLLNVYIIITILFMPCIWYAALRGIADLIGFIFVFLALYYSIDKKFEEEMPIKEPIIFGLLLYIAFLLRRFLIVEDFSIVAAVITVALIRIFSSYQGKDIYTKIKTLLRNAVLIPLLTFFVCMLIIQTQYFISIITFNDSVMDAYAKDLLWNYSDLYRVIMSYNLTLFVASLFFIMLLVKDKNEKCKFIFIFTSLIINTVINGMYMFTNIYALYSVIIIYLIIIISMSKIYEYINKTTEKIFSNIIILFFILVNIICFVLYVTPYKNLPSSIKNLNNCFPKTLELMPSTPFLYEYRDIVNEVNVAIKNDMEITNNKNAEIVFWAYEIVDFSSFKSYIYFVDDELRNNIIPPMEYFTSEGYQLNDLDADYVIVGDPMRLYAQEKDFLPAYKANEAFLKNENIAKSYKLIYEGNTTLMNYEINKEVEAKGYVYKKIKPVTPEQVKELMDIIVKEAPEYKDVYDEQLKEYTRNYNDKYKI